MSTIDFCICTYQRTSVADTLRTLAQMKLPEGCQVRSVIADNDREPSAQVLVSHIAKELSLPLLYLHAPHSNISIARNACLEASTADYIAFIDDDQLISANWLVAALDTAQRSNADIVLGPVYGLHHPSSPFWLRTGGFHDNLPSFVRGKILTGYTGSTLINRRSAIVSPLRFDLAYGVTGGEDTDYCSHVVRLGGTIAFAPEASIFEPVPANRASLRWLMARRTRYGQTHAQQLLNAGAQPKRAAFIALTKAAICYGMMCLSIIHPVHWRRWLLRATLHRAVARTLMAETRHAS